MYFNAGLYYGYQISGRLDTNEGGNDTETRFSDLPEMNGETHPFNTSDFGYILGGTLSFNRGGFAISFLFTRSFDPLVNEAYFTGDADFENLNLRHRAFHVGLQKKF